MKTPYLTVAAAISAAIVSLTSIGCAGPELATTGPAGLSGPPENAGTLVVYSAVQISTFEDSQDYSHYTWYSLQDERGKLLRKVPASVDDIFPRPVPVELPAGRYVVNALDESSKRVSVPVTIRSGESTVVHLDRGAANDPARNEPQTPGGIP
jgi:hypothetical protein